MSAIIPTAIAQRFHQPRATALDLPRLAGGHHTALAIDGSLPAHAATIGEVEEVKRQKDLVVVGHKGHFPQDSVLGSTADRVAHHAHLPVMIVKSP